MKVYVLLERDHDYTNIFGVFSSEEKALDATSLIPNKQDIEWQFVDTEDFELDQLHDYYRPVCGPPEPPPPEPPKPPTLAEAISREYAKIGVLWVPQKEDQDA